MDKLTGFKIFLLQEGKSSSTIEKNVYVIKNILNNFPIISKGNLEQFFLKHLEKGGSRAYLNTTVGVIRNWSKYVNDPKLRELKYFKVAETYKSTMSDSEIESFLSLPYYPGMNKENYELWTLFFKVLAYSGMRPGEVANLTVDSIDFGRNLFILEKTKTIPRQVPIAPSLLRDLTDHVKKCSGILFDRKGKLFNKHMWQHYFDTRIERLGIKRKNLTCYSLRHSFITRWAGEDINIFKIQRIVGHKKIETTANYMHLVTKDLVTAMKKDPLARQSLSYMERFKLFRDLVRKGLEDYAVTQEEEKEMLAGLY